MSGNHLKHHTSMPVRSMLYEKQKVPEASPPVSTNKGVPKNAAKQSAQQLWIQIMHPFLPNRQSHMPVTFGTNGRALKTAWLRIMYICSEQGGGQWLRNPCHLRGANLGCKQGLMAT